MLKQQASRTRLEPIGSEVEMVRTLRAGTRRKAVFGTASRREAPSGPRIANEIPISQLLVLLNYRKSAWTSPELCRV
jgi:hypothetical protein